MISAIRPSVLFVLCVSLSATYAEVKLSGRRRQYSDEELKFYETVFAVGEQVERSAELKAQWNERVRRSQNFEPIPPVFDCDTNGYRSPVKPESVHKLMPGDIDVLAAFGDSISAGNGLGATTLLEVAIPNRGEVYSIGGDGTLEGGVVTLPNIMRKFNPNVVGYSICASWESFYNKAWFNVADPGGTSDDMLSQAEKLVERMRDDPQVNMTNDWKMLTFFVGGNDLCASCRRNYSAERYYYEFERTLVMLKANLTRTYINLVSMFDISVLQNFSTGIVCDLLQWGFCDCARNWTSIPTLRPLQWGYHEAFARLASDERFKRDDFTVVHQTHLANMTPPIDPTTGDYIQDFLSPDCFHPSRMAHQAFAVYLWNTMLIPVGQKPLAYDSQEFNLTVTCPTQENPYIFTDENSLVGTGSTPKTSTPTPAPPASAGETAAASTGAAATSPAAAPEATTAAHIVATTVAQGLTPGADTEATVSLP